MTLQLCFDFCTSRGMTYAGVQYARECFCGPQDVDLSANGPSGGPRAETECNLRCAGDLNQFCGAGLRLNIYDVTRGKKLYFFKTRTVSDGNILMVSCIVYSPTYCYRCKCFASVDAIVHDRCCIA